ncbi:hypothetical protein ACFW04_006612 [Cataglyphis niger]
MKTKKLSMKKKIVEKQILPVTKRGGILPILPLLEVLDSLTGGAAGIAKAVNNSKYMLNNPIMLRANHNTLKSKIKCIYRIKFNLTTLDRYWDSRTVYCSRDTTRYGYRYNIKICIRYSCTCESFLYVEGKLTIL